MATIFEQYIGDLEEELRTDLIKVYKDNSSLFITTISQAGFPTQNLNEALAFGITLNDFFTKCKGLNKDQLQKIFQLLYRENQGLRSLGKANNLLGQEQKDNESKKTKEQKIPKDLSELFKFVQAFPLEGRTRLIYTCRSDIENIKFDCPDINPDPKLIESRTVSTHIPVDEFETYGLCVAWYGLDILGNQENFVKSCICCSKVARKYLDVILKHFEKSELQINPDEEINEILTDNLIVIGENDFSNRLFDLIKHQISWRYIRMYTPKEPIYDISPEPPEIKNKHYSVKLYFKNSSSSSSNISQSVKDDLNIDYNKWGILTFVPNPFAPDKWIIFLVGCHRPGQYLLLSWLRQVEKHEIFSKIIDFKQQINSQKCQFIQIIVKGKPQLDQTNKDIDSPIYRHWDIEIIEDQEQDLPFFTNRRPQTDFEQSNIGDYISDLSLLAKIPSDAQFLQSIKNTIEDYPSLRKFFQEEENNENIGFHVTLYEFLHTQGDQDQAFLKRILDGKHNFLPALKREFNNLCPLHLIARQTRITSTSLQVLVDMYMYEEEFVKYREYLGEKSNRDFRWEYINPNAMDIVFKCCKNATQQIPHREMKGHEFNVNKIPLPLHLTILRFPTNTDKELLNDANSWASQYKTKVWGKLENCPIVLTGTEEFPFSQVRAVKIID